MDSILQQGAVADRSEFKIWDKKKIGRRTWQITSKDWLSAVGHPALWEGGP